MRSAAAESNRRQATGISAIRGGDPMGKNSRSRRNAKRRKQEARRRMKQGAAELRPNRGSIGTDDSDPCMCASCRPDASEAVPEVERLLLVALAILWDNGWQPVEVVRQARTVSPLIY